ncbi:unnamed protein product [Caenorhabditis sp. 36 PRJEB53466]|nr:unnamed protein product [Caenorhabditis sp. 36 PRJEB53466]
MFETEEANMGMVELARQMIERIEKHGTVEGFANSDLHEIIKSTKDLLEPLPCLLEVVSPVIVFGDVHGQIGDLLQFVKVVGRPPDRQLLFLGDYVDRASKSLEVITWLFCMKILHPQKVHLLRGNHEVRRVNAVYGFRDEMLRKRNSELWKAFNDAFSELPIAASINRKILCMHGGISPKIESWATLTDMNKARMHGECDTGLAVDLMWADPNRDGDECGVNSKRGISCVFGKTAIEEVCTKLDIDMIIRAHEVKGKGHEFEFDRRLLTIFSAPYYSGATSNCGSVATISRSLKLQVVTLKPRKRHDLMNEERMKKHEITSSFKPTSDEPAKKVTCQSNFPTNSSDISPFLGTHSMFAHETKHCKKDEEVNVPLKAFVPEEEASALSVILKTQQGYGMAISLHEEEGMSLEAIRQKLGLAAEKENATSAPAVNTPTPDPPVENASASPVPEKAPTAPDVPPDPLSLPPSETHPKPKTPPGPTPPSSAESI